MDGGSRGNPGPAAAAAVATAPDGTALGERAEFIGEATNNVAEYRAIQLGIELGARARRLRGRAGERLAARRAPDRRRVQGEEQGPDAALHRDDGGAARVRPLERPRRPPRAERARGPARQRGARPPGGRRSAEETTSRRKPRSKSCCAAGRTRSQHREMAFLEALLAPEFTLTTGRPGARRCVPASSTSRSPGMSTRWSRGTSRRSSCSTTARFAVVRSRYTQTGRMGDRRRDGTYLMTDAFVKQAGRWRAVTRHITPLAKDSHLASRQDLDECPGAQIADLVHIDRTG